MERGVVQDQDRGPGARRGPGIDGLDDGGRVHRPFAGVGAQLVGRSVVEAQHVEARAAPGPGGDVCAGKLPAVGNGRNKAKARFVAVEDVQVAVLFQRVQFGQFGGLVGVVFRVLGFFQGTAKAPPFAPTLFKKRLRVRGEKSLASS